MLFYEFVEFLFLQSDLHVCYHTVVCSLMYNFCFAKYTKRLLGKIKQHETSVTINAVKTIKT